MGEIARNNPVRIITTSQPRRYVPSGISTPHKHVNVRWLTVVLRHIETYVRSSLGNRGQKYNYYFRNFKNDPSLTSSNLCPKRGYRSIHLASVAVRSPMSPPGSLMSSPRSLMSPPRVPYVPSTHSSNQNTSIYGTSPCLGKANHPCLNSVETNPYTFRALCPALHSRVEAFTYTHSIQYHSVRKCKYRLGIHTTNNMKTVLKFPHIVVLRSGIRFVFGAVFYVPAQLVGGLTFT